MNKKFFCILLLLVLFLTLKVQAQSYRVDYKNLPQELFPGNTPTICILEDNSSPEKLFDKLSDFGDIKRKFNCYSTANLIENKELLKVSNFNAEDQNFLNALNEQLAIEYAIVWKQLSDTTGIYELSVFSTTNHNKLYSTKFMNTVNSNAFLDANKLLIQNLEPVYIPIVSELQVLAKPEGAHFMLYKGDELVKEWTGSEKQKIEPGKYRLVSQADNYMKDERDIELTAEKPISLPVDLALDLSLFPKVISGDNRVTNIKVKPEKDAMKITYDLAGEKGDEYNIKMVLRDSLTNSTSELKQISGDTKDLKPKPNNSITWLYKNELARDSSFRNVNVQMELDEKGGTPWYYYVGGAAAVGVGAAVLLGGKKGGGDGSSGSRTAIQPPPVRP